MNSPAHGLAAAIGLRFTKMSGAGNDFVVLVEPPTELDFAELARRVCRRGTSVGADGLFLLHRISAGARMTHYNADGGVAELCLNGTRCAADLAMHLGWSPHPGEGRVTIETGAGPVRAERWEDGVRMEVPVPGPVRNVALRLEKETGDLPVSSAAPECVLAATCNTGVPHLVVQVASSRLVGLDLDRLGPPLRAHPDLGSAGANVNFVAAGAAPEPRVLRTFERGVEGETLACGTGAVACAAVLLEGRDGTQTFRTQGGFQLTVDARTVDGERTWTLAGEARSVFEGTIHEGALV